MDWASLPAELLALCYAYTQQTSIAGDPSARLKDRCSQPGFHPGCLASRCCCQRPAPVLESRHCACRCRLRGEAVCRHWRTVLRELPFEELQVDGPLPDGARRWLAAAKPRVHSLRCSQIEQNTPLAQLEELLSVLEPQVGRRASREGRFEAAASASRAHSL